MNLPVAAAALLSLVLCNRPGQAQDDGPRQLGGAPAVPNAPRPTPPPPRQIDAVPAPAAPDTSSVGVAPQPGPATAPQPVYVPTPPGQLPGNNSPSPRFQVGLKSGMVYNVRDVESRSPLFGHSYLLLDGQRKVDYADVAYYEDETGHYVRTTLPNSNRETTFKREKTGRISLYSTTSTTYNNYGPGYGGVGYGGFGYPGRYGSPYGGYRTVKTEYFSKDNGPVQNMTMRNLALATADNPGAQQLLADGRRYQTYVTASYVAGGGLLLYGLLQSLKTNSTGISPLVYLAVPILIVPVVLQGKQIEKQRDAIALYNSGR